VLQSNRPTLALLRLYSLSARISSRVGSRASSAIGTSVVPKRWSSRSMICRVLRKMLSHSWILDSPFRRGISGLKWRDGSAILVLDHTSKLSSVGGISCGYFGVGFRFGCLANRLLSKVATGVQAWLDKGVESWLFAILAELTAAWLRLQVSNLMCLKWLKALILARDVRILPNLGVSCRN
jgi:hypothetical protein